MSLVGSLRGVQAIPEPRNSNSNSDHIWPNTAAALTSSIGQ
jgi:hypothetical protein